MPYLNKICFIFSTMRIQYTGGFIVYEYLSVSVQRLGHACTLQRVTMFCMCVSSSTCESVSSCFAQGLPVGEAGSCPPSSVCFPFSVTQTNTSRVCSLQNHSAASSDLSPTSVDLQIFTGEVYVKQHKACVHRAERCV